MKKFLALAMAGAALVALSSQADAAVTLKITNVSTVYSGAPTVDLHKTNSPTEEVNNAVVSPQKLTGYYTNAPTVPVELFAYCVDIFDYSGTGTFDVVSASSYLSTAKYNVLAQLIMAQGAQTSKLHDAAVQLAIWEIVNESSSNAYNLDKVSGAYPWSSTPAQFWADDVKNGSGLISLAESFISDAVKNAGKTTPGLTLYVAKSDVKQDMLFWSYTPPPSVPEPATWAMMIAGMGAVGYSMRRRKVDVSFA